MKIVVVGAGGMLAKYLLAVMRPSFEVASFTRSQLDITLRSEGERLSLAPGDYLLNCAAFTDVDGAERDYRSALSVNAVGVMNLAMRAKRSGAILVHYSTDFIFDGNSHKPYGIYDRPSPISSYGQTKWIGECFIRDVGCDHIIIRTSWLFGRGKRNFISAVLSRAAVSSEIDVVADQVGNPTYALDLANATMALIDARALGTFHVTNSGSCSRAELAREAIRLTGLQCEVVEVATQQRPGVARRPAYSVLDPFPLKETIGYTLPDWRDALRRYLLEEGFLKE